MLAVLTHAALLPVPLLPPASPVTAAAAPPAMVSRSVPPDSSPAALAPSGSSSKSSLASLPPELIQVILAHAPRPSILSLSRTSAYLHACALRAVWQALAIDAEAPQVDARIGQLVAFFGSASSAEVGEGTRGEQCAKAVRYLAVGFGAGELSNGEEALHLARLIALLPNLQALDVRAGSMGRYRGRLDPLFTALDSCGWAGTRLDTLVLKGLVHSLGPVVKFLGQRRGNIKRLFVDLTLLQLGSDGHPMQHAQVAFDDWSALGPEDALDAHWRLTPAVFPSVDTVAPDAVQTGAEDVFDRVEQLTAPLSSVERALLSPHTGALQALTTLDLELGHFPSSSAREVMFDVLCTLLSRAPNLRALRLSGGIEPTPPLVARLAGCAPALTELDLMDAFGFVRRVPACPLTGDLVGLFSSLRLFKLRVWGYFALSYKRAIPSSVAAAPSLPPSGGADPTPASRMLALIPEPDGIERVSLATVVWRVVRAIDGDGEGGLGVQGVELDDVQPCVLGDPPHGAVFGEALRFLL